jgi:lactate dehydrogenase-like 2-hydroxyacid dehydrogenase
MFSVVQSTENGFLTMKRKILALGSMLPSEMEELEKDFDVIKLWKEPDPEQTLQSFKADIIAILSTYNGIPVTRKIIESLPNLELIAHFGVGVNNVDVDFAKVRSIAVTNTPDVVTADTADMAIGLMLSTARRIVEADMFVRIGKWSSGAFPVATSLNNKIVGICGMGRIGQAIAHRCAAFGMKIIYHGTKEKPDLPYRFYSDLKEMARVSDFLVLSCSGGDATHHIVNAAVLKALGRKGYLINVARGSVVNTEDLLVALRNREIAGAGLDVYENEPSVPDSLISMDNVVLLPHIGGGTVEARSAMGGLVIENIKAHFNGEPLISPVAA